MAGIGASGAVLAGAIVAFVVLVGAVSFDAWPESGPSPTAERGELFSTDDGATPAPRRPAVASARPDGAGSASGPASTSEPGSASPPSSGGDQGGGGSQTGGGGGDGGDGGGGNAPSRPSPKPSTGVSQSGGTAGTGGGTGIADEEPSPPQSDDEGSRPGQGGNRN